MLALGKRCHCHRRRWCVFCSAVVSLTVSVVERELLELFCSAVVSLALSVIERELLELFYSAVVSLAVSVVERELLELLPLSEQCSADEAELVRFCYENILNKVGRVCKKCFSTRLFLCIKHDTYNVLK